MIMGEVYEMFLSKEKIVICASSNEYKRHRDALIKSGAKTSFIGERNTTFLTLARDIVLRYQIETSSNLFPEVISPKEFITVIYLNFLRLLKEGSLVYFTKNMISYSLACSVYQIIKKVYSENVYDSFEQLDSPKIKDIVKVIRVTNEFFASRGMNNNAMYLSEEQLYIKALSILKEHQEYIDRQYEYEYIGNGEIGAVLKEILSFYIPCLKVSEKELLKLDSLCSSFSSVIVQNAYGSFNEVYGVVNDIVKKEYLFSEVALYLSTSGMLLNVLSALDALQIPYRCLSSLTEEKGEIFYTINELFDIKYAFITRERAYGIIEETPDSKKYINYLIQLRSSESVCAKEFFTLTSEFIGSYWKAQRAHGVCEALDKTSLLIPEDFVMSHYEVKSLVLNTIKDVAVPKEEKDGGILVGTFFSDVPEGRKHLYIIGMDSSSFGIKEAESPIMSDDELKAIGVSDNRVNMTSRSVEKEYSALTDIIKSSSSIGTSSLFVSYVAFDSVNMIEKNPSPFVMKLKKACNIDQEVMVAFSDKTSLKEKASIDQITDEIQEVKKQKLQDIRLSATSVKTFIDCQRKFYYTTVLKLKSEVDTSIKLDTWLLPNVKGDFVHEVLKEYICQSFIYGVVSDLVPDKQKMDAVIETHTQVDEKLLKKIIDSVDKKYSDLYPALDKVHDQELKILTDAITDEIKRTVSNLKDAYPVAAEWTSDKEFQCHKMAFSKKSRIDRIDYNLSDSTYTIIDYKVKNTKSSAQFKESHVKVKDIEENDNIQEYLYYLIVNDYLKRHNNKKSVKNVVFRLVLTGEDVSIENLTSAYGIIDDKVNKIQNAIENNIWQSPEDCKEICMYCDYKYICRDIIDVNEKADKESDDE